MNAYLLADGPDPYLIDTACLPGDAQEVSPELIDDFLKCAGVAGRELAGVVVTHFHRDHAGGVSWISNTFGTPVFAGRPDLFSLRQDWQPGQSASEEERQWLIEMGVPFHKASLMACDHPAPIAVECAPTMTISALDGGEVLSTGRSDWLVVATPGHTSGHICLWNRVDGFVITGDTVLPPGGGNAYVGKDVFSRLTNPLGSYLQSIKSLANLSAGLVLPGHGQAIEPLGKLCDRHIEHQARAVARLAALLSPDAVSAYSLCRRVIGSARFDRLRPRHQLVAVSETVARLTSLVCRGIAANHRDTAMVTWTATDGPDHPTRDAMHSEELC